MRTFVQVFAALMALATVAQAQVAAPRINPTAPVNPLILVEQSVQLNPAVLPFAGPSRVSAAMVDVDVDNVTADQSTGTIYSGNGYPLQALWVGETFAAVAELNRVELDASVAANGSLKIEGTAIGAAGHFDETVGVGVLRHSSEVDDTDPAGPNTNTFTQTDVGINVRLAEVFYIGVASGAETVERKVPGTTVQADRDALRYGIAYHMRDKERGLHIEAYQETKDHTAASAAVSAEEEQATGITAEAVFSNVLVAYESESRDYLDAAGTKTSTDTTTAYSIGWTPGEKVAIVYTVGTAEGRDTVNDGADLNFTRLAVAWQF